MLKKMRVALAVAAAMAAGSAQAYVIAENGNGLLVPHVVHNGATDTTVVGLISREAGTVYWTFFDVDSNHVTDGQFDVTANDLASFVWATEAGFGLAGEDGYLVFLLDDSGDAGLPDGVIDGLDTWALAGNALQVNTAAQDVAFVPTQPLDSEDFWSPETLAWEVADPTTLDADSLAELGIFGRVDEGVRLDMRYFVDGAPGGTDTAILVWTAQDSSGSYTVNIYDDEQNRKSVNFVLPNAELNVFNPEAIVGRPSSFLDGFIEWVVPDFGELVDSNGDGTGDTGLRDSVFAYSVVSAPAFGAVQTLIATHDGSFPF